MKMFTLTMIAVMGLTVFSALGVLADTSNPGADKSSGNQLMQNQTHWYEKAAQTINPAKEVTSETGTVLNLQPGSYLYLEGDSTLHKYQMNANVLSGSAEIKAAGLKEGGALLKAMRAGKVGSMVLDIPVATLKSRESGLDDNAHKALKAADNPDIKFVLDKEALKDGGSGGGAMTAFGKLTIAGSTAPVTLQADAAFKDGQVELKGVQKLKMSDFKVAPPSISLLVTSINCTDEITIHYDVKFAVAK